MNYQLIELFLSIYLRVYEHFLLRLSYLSFLYFSASGNTSDQMNEGHIPQIENEQKSPTKRHKVNVKPTKKEIVDDCIVYHPEHGKLHTESCTFGTTYEDADKAFLLSLLPDYKKLNDDEKIDFRLHTLQFFRNLIQKHENS